MKLRIINIAGLVIKRSITDGRRLILHYIGISDYMPQYHNASYNQEAKLKHPYTTQGNGCYYHNRRVTIITVGNVMEVTRCGVDKHEFSLDP